MLQNEFMKLCRFKNKENKDHAVRIGLVNGDSTVTDLTAAGIEKLTRMLDAEEPVALVGQLAKLNLPRLPLAEIQLLAPVGWQEVWAAGVTYLRSKTARMEESDFSASAYDKVYAAERPEIFFKSLPQKVVGPGEAVGIRRDAKWSVPEPELALVMNSRGKIVGHTIGNDMSSRDIEGENLLYLPQAKTYQRSCAIGPCVVIGAAEADARRWEIHLVIERAGAVVFDGQTSVAQIKRS